MTAERYGLAVELERGARIEAFWQSGVRSLCLKVGADGPTWCAAVTPLQIQMLIELLRMLGRPEGPPLEGTEDGDRRCTGARPAGR